MRIVCVCAEGFQKASAHALSRAVPMPKPSKETQRGSARADRIRELADSLRPRPAAPRGAPAPEPVPSDPENLRGDDGGLVDAPVPPTAPEVDAHTHELPEGLPMGPGTGPAGLRRYGCPRPEALAIFGDRRPGALVRCDLCRAESAFVVFGRTPFCLHCALVVESWTHLVEGYAALHRRVSWPGDDLKALARELTEGEVTIRAVLGDRLC